MPVTQLEQREESGREELFRRKKDLPTESEDKRTTVCQ